MRRWKDLTLLKYMQKLQNFESFCELEDVDINPHNIDSVLLSFAMHESTRLAPSTLATDLAALKTVFRDILFWQFSSEYTDSYIKGYKKSAASSRPTSYIAARISLKDFQEIKAICINQTPDGNLYSNITLATAAWLQFDTVARISNIIGQYGLCFKDVLDSKGDIFVENGLISSVPTVVIFRGSKTRISSFNRKLVIHDVKLRSVFGKVLKSLYKGVLTQRIFDGDVFRFNRFLNSRISSTSHALRSLGARCWEERTSTAEAMSRGDWKTLASFRRYTNN